MLTAVHALVYAEDPEAARAFVRDVLRLKVPGAGELTLYQPTYDPPSSR